MTSLRCRTYRCSTFIDPAIVLLLPVVQASSVSHYCYPEQQKNHNLNQTIIQQPAPFEQAKNFGEIRNKLNNLEYIIGNPLQLS